MAREIVHGENEVFEKGDKRDRLRQLLQLGPGTSTAPALVNGGPQVHTRVGQRKPIRDVIGTAEEVLNAH
jgi:hypothetical protein